MTTSHQPTSATPSRSVSPVKTSTETTYGAWLSQVTNADVPMVADYATFRLPHHAAEDADVQVDKVDAEVAAPAAGTVRLAVGNGDAVRQEGVIARGSSDAARLAATRQEGERRA